MKTRIEKNKTLRINNFIIEYLLTLLYFIIGLLRIMYLIHKLLEKIFNLLPKTIKATIIYTMIILSIMYITKPRTQVIYKEKVIEVESGNQQIEEVATAYIEQPQEQEQTNTEINMVELNNENANNIYNKAIDKGFTKEQAILAVSISRHETGNWTSKAFNDKHNFGGIMCNKATQIKRYETYEEGLEDFLRILKTYYFDLGLNDIAEIGAKYCPIGAANDPNGLNKYWVGGVTEFYNEYIKMV